MVQVLHISNGNTINGKLTAKENQLHTLLETYKDDPASMLDELFLTALSRYPKPHEKTAMVRLLTDSKPDQHRPILEDIAWGIFSSREFLFNH